MNWDFNWGSVPDWVAAIGTVGTLVAALWIFFDDRKRRISEEDNKAARHISAWAQIQITEKKTNNPYVSALMKHREFLLSAKNTGEDPVYDCMIFSNLPIKGVRLTDEGSVLSENNASSERIYNMFGVLPPGETLIYTISGEEVEDEYQGLPDVWLEFTDAGGTHWKRDEHGKLEKLKKRTDWD